jgi:SAM-dependent methyltransferase
MPPSPTPIVPASAPAPTADAAYLKKLAEELRIFSPTLKVHDLPDIHHYWSHEYLRPRFHAVHVDDITDVFVYATRIAAQRKGAPVRALALGAGNCDFEVSVLERLGALGCTAASIDCLDLAGDMLARGEQLARERGVRERMRFLEADLNAFRFGSDYDLFFANQSLHHFVELELLFDKIAAALPEHGYFVASDMIGRNGHMHWPEAYEVVCTLWKLLPEQYRFNHQMQVHEEVFQNRDCSTEGFEGIRAQDILPLLVERFHFEFFAPWGNLIDAFIGRAFGPNFSERDPFARAFIDFVALLDERLVREGELTPTHLVAAMTKSPPARYLSFDGLPPRFYLRAR